WLSHSHHRRHHRPEPAADRLGSPDRRTDRRGAQRPAEYRLMNVIENAVAGKRYVSTGRRVPVFNPATGEVSAELPLSTMDELNAAVASAKQAQIAWGKTTPMKRARVMFKFKALLDQHADELAREISREHGKVHDDALGEVARGIDCVDFACGIPQLLKGEFSRNVGPSIDTYSDRQPLGV